MLNLNLFIRNPVEKMARLRDRADRTAISFLEDHAVRGSITREIVASVADAVNRDPRYLVQMVPDRRRPRRYEQAMAGLRSAGLLGGDDDR